ncbi:PepSY domain-containing protein, partial [Streptomyces sp. Act-28]
GGAPAGGSIPAALPTPPASMAPPGGGGGAERHDDATRWEVEVLGEDGRTHDLRVDASKATLAPGDDRDDDRSDDDRSERAAQRAAGVNAAQATARALTSRAGATVTSVDFDDDGGWEVELRDADGSEAETRIDAEVPGTAGSARTPATADDDRDDDKDDGADDDRDD